MTTTRHMPVLLQEVLAGLQPLDGALVIDATFGAGGYSRALLKQGARVIGLDRDPNAIGDGQALVDCYQDRLTLVQTQFSKLDQVTAARPDAVILDIGVSSMQIDEADRGFSFQRDGPLDMRMAQSGPSAGDVVNHLKANELARVFRFLGEERHAGRIARMIEKRRLEAPFKTTSDLANAIEACVGRKPNDRIHPATRVFQALRIYVNNELGELVDALFAAEAILPQGGRLGVVTFHSLEDRIVKRFFADRSARASGSRHLPVVETVKPSFKLLFKGVREATAEEVQHNPRARSAKLRVGVRTSEPAYERQKNIFALPELARFEGLN